MNEQTKEAAILGTILEHTGRDLPPNISRLIQNAPESFDDQRHGQIAVGIHTLNQRGEPVSTVALSPLLKFVGSDAMLMALPDSAQNIEAAEFEAQTLWLAYQSRRAKSVLSDAARALEAAPGQAGSIITNAAATLQCLATDSGKFVSEVIGFDELLRFDTTTDSANLIGIRDGKATRWICRGYGAWLIGQSGIGKSSLLIQLAVAFACGMALWGVTPARPLRVLLVQAENDMGDVAEMIQGVANAMNLAGDFPDEELVALVRENIRVLTLTGTVGAEFCRWLGREIKAFNADVVMVDPLLSFAGCDLSRTEQATTFLRVWLDPILRDTGAAMIAAHHTGKPNLARGQIAPTIYDMAYAGIGSSELVNWARATMLLSPVDNAFRLAFAKRGKRAGATTLDGEPTQEVWLRHGQTGICWEQIEAPAEPEQSPSRNGRPHKTKADMFAHVPIDGAIPQTVLLDKANGAGIGQKRARALLDELIADGAVHVHLVKRKGTNPEKRISRTPQPEPELPHE